MNSDDEEIRDEDSPRGSSSDEESEDADIAAVLTQLIRRLVIYPLMFLEWCVDQFNVRQYLPLDSGRAHILSERNSVFEERGETFHDFLSSTRPPLFDKPDLTVLEVMNYLIAVSNSIIHNKQSIRRQIYIYQQDCHREFISTAANPILLVSHPFCTNVKLE